MDSYLTRLEAAVVPAREKLYRTGLGSALLDGTVTMALYKGYLRETFHFVRHTPRFLAAAASRFPVELELVRKRFLHHAAEEFGHELLALHDLEALGTPKAETLATEPLVATRALIAFHYFQAEREDPVGLLGTIYALEGLGQKAGPRAAKALASLGLPRAATTFITVHGELDVDHMEEAVKTIEQFVRTPDQERVVTYCARAAYELYALMFDAIWERDGKPARIIAPDTAEMATAGA